MTPRSARWAAIALLLLLAAGCTSAPGGQSTPAASNASLGGGAGQAGGGGGQGGHGNASDAPSDAPTTEPSPTPTPTVPPTPEVTPISGGPYLVKQTGALGDLVLETPPGGVCVDTLWRIPAHNPSVSFSLVFDPHGVYPGITGNTFGYYYEIASAGETDHAEGGYTLTPHGDGSLTVAVTAQDHVTFNGFDGYLPVSGAFDLVPMGGDATCS